MPLQNRGKTDMPAAKVMVKNLSPRTSAEDLRKIFKSCSENIADVFVPSNRMTGTNKGFAVVKFYNVDAAYDAIDALDGCRMDGYVLELELKKLPRPVKKLCGAEADLLTSPLGVVSVRRAHFCKHKSYEFVG